MWVLFDAIKMLLIKMSCRECCPHNPFLPIGPARHLDIRTEYSHFFAQTFGKLPDEDKYAHGGISVFI